MRQQYIAPQSDAIMFYAEDTLAGASLSVNDNQNAAITDKGQYLSNKKEHPIWGEQKTDMWKDMK